MPREYNFGTSKTVVEEDSNGNVSVKNVDSLSTEEVSVGNAGARMEVNNATTVPSSTETTVEFGSNAIDEGGYINLSNNEFEAPTDGVYLLSGVVLWDSPDATGEFRLTANTPDEQTTQFHIAESSGNLFSQEVTTIAQMNAGDTATLTVRQDTGSSQDIYARGGAANFTNYQIALLG